MQLNYFKCGLIAAISLAAASLSGCRDKGDPNPCANETPTSAEFAIKEQIGISFLNKIRLYEVDTIGVSSRIPIVFLAKDSIDAQYEWTIGNDPRVYTQREVSLSFDQNYGPVRIQLKVRKTPNKACFPNDTGIAVSEKNLVVVPQPQAPIYGEYEGYNLSRPNRKFTVRIQPNSLLNLPEGCRYDMRGEVLIGSTALLAYSNTFDPTYGAGSLSGWGALDRSEKRKLTFEYTYSDPTQATPGPRISDTFVGYRK